MHSQINRWAAAARAAELDEYNAMKSKLSDTEA